MEWLLPRWDDEAWLNKVNVAWVKDKQEREKRLAEIEKTTAKEKTPRWYVNGQGQTMIVLPDAGRPFTMGARPLEADRLGLGPPHPMRIRRTFAVSATSRDGWSGTRGFPVASRVLALQPSGEFAVVRHFLVTRRPRIATG